MEDITVENYVEYQTYPSLEWHPCQYEQSVVDQLLKSKFDEYVGKVKTTDCQAELRRLLASGPPIYISDKHAMPLPDGDTHIVKLWYSSDSQERPAVLEGALQGQDRKKLWDELNEFIIVEGGEEGDEVAE
eukprot:CAMPEP_0113658480 /NCGR_PEP_ID=MMETSP0017_2-20120614/31742_1 /TAXON_ID=2856 /ORGANISM="Cylindrotheca closterium" /LENGTH=130 /DNA_ID=CAMNT_0000572757 /DNA_START=74 /DNA_END=466 /DNA_ORIENTATION=+ /assembly_acc=CAM_ASM_000147